MATFRYSHSLQDKNIRLLKVTPGSEPDALAIRLFEKDLDEARFKALSYVGGLKKILQSNAKVSGFSLAQISTMGYVSKDVATAQDFPGLMQFA
jgi:hypothetical protein